MRKANRGPALFEVIVDDGDLASEALNIPKWWSRGERQAGSPVGSVARDRTIPRTGRSKSAPSDVEIGETPPFFELVGGRVRVSFTSLAAAGVVFGLMVVMLGAFELGTRSGHKTGLRTGFEAGRASYAADAMSEIELARSQPPATHLVSDLLTDAAPKPTGREAAADPDAVDHDRTEWIRGYTYIVAQEFAAYNEADARLARGFLEEHGIPTALVRLPNGASQLITTQGYNRREPTQAQLADALLEKVQGIGAQYFSAGGGYRLKGYFKTRKDEAW